ncbi:MAG: glycerophosphodiester phosphodiesterase family protein [Spiroplasma sp.]|nr:glycerophosphodiester phosphodiesterase family protein [Spiroplasma sp.]
MPILVAHRGFRTPTGENRMIDFINALKTCQAVEFDIRMTKDQKIIIFHDHNFKRIGKIDKTVRSLTYQEIKALPWFNNHPEWLPALFIDDFIKKIANKYHLINVEIKADRYSQAEFQQLQLALELLRSETKAEIIVSSFSYRTLKFIANLNSNLFKKGYLIEKLSDLDQNLLQHFDYLNPYLGTIKRKSNVATIKSINLPMNIWTFKYDKDVEIVNNLYPKKLINSYISDIANLKID